jgi:hypothetical protein
LFEEKTRGKKSLDTVPLSIYLCIVRIVGASKALVNSVFPMTFEHFSELSANK